MAKKVVIYTDGACSGNPGPGGWGAVIIFENETKEISGCSVQTTNNIMELTAPIESLKILPEKHEIQIYTDSVYVKNGITVWIHGWKKNGWRTANGQPVKNAELWRQLDELNKKHLIEWLWVKGHSDNPLNNRADFLATNAIKK